MFGSSVAEALIFLIDTVFGLYLLAVALRFLLQWVRADFYNPISQFLVAVTNPPLRVLRRFIPGYRGIDFSSLVLMLAIKLAELCLETLIAAGGLPAAAGLLVLGVAELLNLFIYIFLFAIIIQIVVSWVSPGAYNPVTVILYRLTDPLLRPARRIVPPVGGLDFSPILPIVALQLLIILLIKPLLRLGYSLGGFVQ